MKISKVNNVRMYRTTKEAYLTKDSANDEKCEDEIYDKWLKNSLKFKLKRIKNDDKMQSKYKDNLKKSIESNTIKVDKEKKDLYVTLKDRIESQDGSPDKFLQTFELDQLLLKIEEEMQKNHSNPLPVILKMIRIYQKNYIIKQCNNISDQDRNEICLFYKEIRQYFKSQLSKKRINTNKNYVLNKEYMYHVILDRINNKLTQYYIQLGKLNYYKGIHTVNGDTSLLTSDTLCEIKALESLRKQFIISFVYIASMFCECGDNADFFLNKKKDLSFEKSDDTLKNSFMHTFNCDDSNCKNNGTCDDHLQTWYLYLRYLRNNIFHFKNPYEFLDSNSMIDGTLNKLDKEHYEEYKEEIKNIYLNDIDNIHNRQKELIEQLNLNDVIVKITEPNDDAEKNNIVRRIQFPNASKVIKKGFGMINKTGMDIGNVYNFYLDCYDNDDYKQKLHLLYKHNFVNGLTVDVLTNAIKEVLEINKKLATKNKKNKQCFKYNTIEQIWNSRKNDKTEESLIEFFIEIQRNESDLSSRKGDDNKNKYTDFKLDVFAYAFAKMFYGKENITINICDYDKKSIKDNDMLIPYYCLFKFLDKMQLSNIQLQLQKFIAITNVENYRNVCVQLIKLIDIVKVCNTININNTNSDNTNIDSKIYEYLEKFVNLKDLETNKELRSIYFQNNNDNDLKECKPIYHKGVVDGCMKNYISVYSNFCKKINKADLEAYNEWRDNKTNNNCTDESNDNCVDKSHKKIDELQKNRKELHQSIVERKSGDKIQLEKDLNEYDKCMKDIIEYNEIKNKVTFVDLQRLSVIHYRIISRLIGFAVDWERDMYFLFLGIYSDSNQNNENLKSDIDNIFKKGSVVGEMKQLFEKDKDNEDIKNIKEHLQSIYNVENVEDLLKIFKIRNNISHMNLLFYKEKNGNLVNKNILDFMLETQKLMKYDRKKRNAVTKSIIEILNNDNLDVEFAISKSNANEFGHVCTIKKIESKQSIHLNKFNYNLNSNNYINLVKKLLNYKSK